MMRRPSSIYEDVRVEEGRSDSGVVISRDPRRTKEQNVEDHITIVVESHLRSGTFFLHGKLKVVSPLTISP